MLRLRQAFIRFETMVGALNCIKKRVGDISFLQLDEPCPANTISPGLYDLVSITTRKPEISEHTTEFKA
ncbi:hypothetical protein NC653_025438 [Populus alba x Populus x berolinensis]|uniref:Uncharacterized protein n=1 Tax=Populus alba x Populus x berolinensis TaxID=444605 RepID=A0AAD6MBB6_9ROSI|nr:hypothetical protein NC653_025438 [Populus alba x Populus x berolinensis]